MSRLQEVMGSDENHHKGSSTPYTVPGLDVTGVRDGEEGRL